MNTVTANFNITVRQMTEMSQQKMTEMSQRKKTALAAPTQAMPNGESVFMSFFELIVIFT